jgi:hypothetical protein
MKTSCLSLFRLKRLSIATQELCFVVKFLDPAPEAILAGGRRAVAFMAVLQNYIAHGGELNVLPDHLMVEFRYMERWVRETRKEVNAIRDNQWMGTTDEGGEPI